MSEEQPMPAVPGIPPEPAAGKAGRWLRLSRGFSCLFWSLPLLSAAHAFSFLPISSLRWMFALLLACFLPLVCGLWMLRDDGTCGPRWGGKHRRAALLTLVAIYLCPFLVWWNLSPLRLYFAANMAAHYVAMIALLVVLNRLAGEFAREVGDAALRREALAGLIMVLWLSGCTVAALGWLFHRAGLLEAGLPAVLAQLAQLPREARTLFLLPYAMTAYVMWRTKETGFRRASQPAA